MQIQRENVDSCVIGGGIVGMFCALELALSGHNVRLIDKLRTGSSRFNIGEIMLQGHSLDEVELLELSHKRWQRLMQGVGQNFGYEKRGSAYLALNENERERLMLESGRDEVCELRSSYISDPNELSDLLGGARLGEAVIGGKVSEDDAVVDCEKALDSVRKMLIQHGVKIWGSDYVEEFITDKDSPNTITGIRTDSGEECYAKNIIICTGVWAGEVLKKLNINLPIRPARSHLLDISCNGKTPDAIIAHNEKHGDIIIRYMPRTGRSIVSYAGIMDQAQATWSTEVDKKAVSWMQNKVGELLPALQHAKLHDIRTITIAVTPDNLPFIGNIPNKENLYIASGFNGRSFAYAPGVGRVMADIITKNTPKVDITTFSPQRFS